jgi:hypothetical protein
MSVTERTQAERDAEAKALGFVPASDDITQAERRGYCKGWDAAVAHSRTIKGAVGALAILNEAMGDVASAEWPDDARTYIARAAAALGGQ